MNFGSFDDKDGEQDDVGFVETSETFLMEGAFFFGTDLKNEV